MPTNLKCPNCGHQFDAENVIAADLEQKLQQQYQQKLQESLDRVEADKKQLQEQQQKFEEARKNANEIFAQKLQQEKQKLEAEAQERITRSVAADYENKLRMLENNNKDNEEKLKEARKKEFEFLQKEQELKNKEAELEIKLQRELQKERELMTEQIRKQETEKSQLKETEMQLKLKEVQLQLEEQRKLAEEMKRRAEQGSMQRQGEVQELLLEEILKENFPFDAIEEVGKGVEGADCIQIVRTNTGKECGRIIYESKRTKTWSNNWVDKLKTDKRSKGADIAILVSQVFPRDMERFGERDGIWICNFTEVASVAQVLRSGIIKINEAIKSQENKGDKMQMLYDYLTGNEFRGNVEAILEGFMSVKNGIIKEKAMMEKIWKEREKQMEKAILNTSSLYGSVKGIAGASVSDIPLLDGGNEMPGAEEN
ncbi:MAG TPA: DUF2130 domain-containing protein [Ferruginibacter sp.]|nr:DUF2130 domain-containing protein [Ferruginibacter sp.]HPH92769.1 DUF2130 domain-containing protein [Ferruginibacter sp.]